MAVVFLDFDGPIFPQKVMSYPENMGINGHQKARELDLYPMTNYWKADPFSIQVLNSLRKIYPYKLVISSTWADLRCNTQAQIDNVLRANSLDYEMHNDYMTPRHVYTRHEQIAEWLNNHNEHDYLIIDDIRSGPKLNDMSLMDSFSLKNIILIDDDDGINQDNYEQMKKIVTAWV